MSVQQDYIKAEEVANPVLLFEADQFFNKIYQQGLERSGTPNAKRRPERFYNTVQLFLQTLDLPGSMAECGCWKGLSSFIFCHYIRTGDETFRGENYHIFDSFQGLNTPTGLDNLPQTTTKSLESKFGTVRGAFQADLKHVKNTLVDFPQIRFHKGWMPKLFSSLPEKTYRFVHVDVDLYEPTFGAVAYFYPRLVSGGLIVCDDYGSLAWPGAKRAIDAYCQRMEIKPLILSTGQAILFKRNSQTDAGPGHMPQPLAQSQSVLSRIHRWLSCPH
jgi:O-methyltransferase